MDAHKPHRRRFRFSLISLFVALTVLGIGLGWLGHRVRQRSQMMQWIENNGGSVSRWQRPEPVDLGNGIFFEHSQRVGGPEKEPEIPHWRTWWATCLSMTLCFPQGLRKKTWRILEAIFPEATVEDNRSPSREWVLLMIPFQTDPLPGVPSRQAGLI